MGGGVDEEEEERDFYFYFSSLLIFECLYFCRKISQRFYKMIGLIFELDLTEIGKLFRHICTLCLQPISPQKPPFFPFKLDEKMLTAEKRVIRQILLQNTDLMSKHNDFVASIF